MAPGRVFERNVRPRREFEDHEDSGEDDVLQEEDGGVEIHESNEDDEASADDGSNDEDDGEAGAESMEDLSRSEEEGDVQQRISNVSFSALKQAQAALSRKRKRGSDESPDQEDKLEALRKRLRQIKDEKANGLPSKSERKAKPTSNANIKVTTESEEDEDNDSDSDSDSAPSEEGVPSRTSKHAPAAQSSKRQVTRKRTVVDLPKRHVRDPRFDAIQQRPANTGDNSEKAYSFLDDYARSEIIELKAAMKRTKSEDEKETLRRKINSMENRLKTKAAKERQQDVLRQHRKEEKEKVLQGKTPYYLKKKDLKERALVEKFKGMKSKERTKLVEKRRKKEGQREKKRMPGARRAAG